jgi:hypothetical protein
MSDITVRDDFAPAKTDAMVFPLMDEEVYPRLLDKDLMKDVYRKWMLEPSLTLEEAALQCGAPVQTVLYWADVASWVEQRARAVRVRSREAAASLENQRLEVRNVTVMEQVSMARSITDKVNEAVGKPKMTVLKKDGTAVEVDMSPRDLKELAEAGRAASEIIGKFLGVADAKPVNVDGSDTKTEESQTRPLVVVVKGGGLPQVRMSSNADVINV